MEGEPFFVAILVGFGLTLGYLVSKYYRKLKAFEKELDAMEEAKK